MTTPKITLYRDARGDWRWTWRAGNGRIIAASSEGYRRRVDCVRNLETVTLFRLPLTLDGIFERNGVRHIVEVQP